MLLDELTMKAFAGDGEFPGAAFALTLPTTKNLIALLPIGPGDDLGEYRLSGARLDQLIRDVCSLAMMDYGELLNELWVRVVNLADIASCRRGYEVWGSSGVFPDGYLEMLEAFEASLHPVAGMVLRARAVARGGSLRIEGSAQRA